jgi:hypothetical protein
VRYAFLVFGVTRSMVQPASGRPTHVYPSTSSTRTPGRITHQTLRCSSISRASCSALGASGRRTSRSEPLVFSTAKPERSKCACRSSSRVESPVRSLMPQVLPVRHRIHTDFIATRCSCSNVTESPPHLSPGEVSPTRALIRSVAATGSPQDLCAGGVWVNRP